MHTKASESAAVEEADRGWLAAEEHLTRAALAVKRVEKRVKGKSQGEGRQVRFFPDCL